MTHHTEFLPEAAEAFRKGGAFVYDQNQTILCRRGRTKIFENMESNVGNGLYRVFTTGKRAKEGIHSRNTFFVVQKKGTFLTFKKSGGRAHAPIAPWFRGPWFLQQSVHMITNIYI